MEEEIKTSGNLEIEEALKKFNKQTTQAPSYQAVKFYKESTTPKIVELVIKWSGGAIKEQKQAEYFLLGFIVVSILISLYLFFGDTLLNKFSSTKPASQDQMKESYPELIVP